mmetsp:Transcript_758/g.1821  ORF Transcript_758/g.1821 Transcript_758/m.1821 type:complete len:131 (+) Transcript_758:37-429(+)
MAFFVDSYFLSFFYLVNLHSFGKLWSPYAAFICFNVFLVFLSPIKTLSRLNLLEIALYSANGKIGLLAFLPFVHASHCRGIGIRFSSFSSLEVSNNTFAAAAPFYCVHPRKKCPSHKGMNQNTRSQLSTF